MFRKIFSEEGNCFFLFEVINFCPESIVVEVIHSFEGEKSKASIFDANAKAIVTLVTLMTKPMR